tara:strand:+ start:14035 stop:14355 length:321 start_codon:yes stop_codon:yes gene_type:complete
MQCEPDFARQDSVLECLLGRRILDKLDTLGDVALETVVACLEELLLVVVDAADNVNRFLGTVGLYVTSVKLLAWTPERLTPSSMGTEKKSVPVVFAIASPPVTPGR